MATETDPTEQLLIDIAAQKRHFEAQCKLWISIVTGQDGSSCRDTFPTLASPYPRLDGVLHATMELRAFETQAPTKEVYSIASSFTSCVEDAVLAAMRYVQHLTHFVNGIQEVLKRDTKPTGGASVWIRSLGLDCVDDVTHMANEIWPRAMSLLLSDRTPLDELERYRKTHTVFRAIEDKDLPVEYCIWYLTSLTMFSPQLQHCSTVPLSHAECNYLDSVLLRREWALGSTDVFDVEKYYNAQRYLLDWQAFRKELEQYSGDRTGPDYRLLVDAYERSPIVKYPESSALDCQHALTYMQKFAALRHKTLGAKIQSSSS